MKIEFYKWNLPKAVAASLFAMVLGMFTVFAAAPVTVTGTVRDGSGGAVAGASVLEKGTSNGVVTNVDGRFSITMDPEAVLRVSFLGLGDYETVPGSRRNLDITLDDGAEDIDQIVVVGYGTQRKETLTGAVSAISNKEIVTTKNENVQNMLTGKVPGLRVVQNTSEPGAFDGSIDIRGFGSALIVVDGVPRDNMQRLNPEDIENISVLKDASAAVYGVRGADGVILITTRKGNKNQSSISYSGNMTWQVPSNYPKLVNAAEWMELKNEIAMRNVNDFTRPYSDEDIREYLSGEKQSTDWRSAVMRHSAPQTQHTISATGGNEKITYYSSIGYQYQESFLRTNSFNYEKYTLRSNISAQVSKNIRFDLNISGMIDERKTGPYGSSDILRYMWLMRPNEPIWHDEENRQYRQPSETSHNNPVSMLDTDMIGENNYRSRWLQTGATLTYDVPFVEGLFVKGFYSYDYIMNDNKTFKKLYYLYNSAGDPQPYNRPASADDPDYQIQRTYYGKNHNLWNIQLGFDRQFGKHAVTGMLLFENSHKEGDNFYGRTFAILPIPELFAGDSEGQVTGQDTAKGSLYDYANQAMVGRVTYNFDGKYLAEVAFRYDGSSWFPKDSRWGFFPSVSGGWRISEEQFWKRSRLNFINNFKVRASYGKVGDDSGANYNHYTGYNYPASNSTHPAGLPSGSVFGDSFVIGVDNKGIANNAITWYTSEIFDVGFDIEAWNGLLGISGDYFNRNRKGLLARRTNSLPGIVGSTLPQENLNKDRDRGFEIEVSHRKRIGDFSYQVKGNVSYTRRKTIYYEQADQGNSYLNWRNNNNQRYNNIFWGYAGDGHFTNWNDIYYNGYSVNHASLMGDYRYVDWNGDGLINDLDIHPLATNGQVPLVYYGLTVSAQWRGIDLSMLWQGAGRRFHLTRQFIGEPMWSGVNALKDHLDRWHPVDPHANPYDPSTEWISGTLANTGSGAANPYSDFRMENARYIRLKNLELGYTLPSKWLKAANIQDVRFYFSAYNLLTFTPLKYLDPEFKSSNNLDDGGLSALGYSYPLNKTFTIGLNLKF